MCDGATYWATGRVKRSIDYLAQGKLKGSRRPYYNPICFSLHLEKKKYFPQQLYYFQYNSGLRNTPYEKRHTLRFTITSFGTTGSLGRIDWRVRSYQVRAYLKLRSKYIGRHAYNKMHAQAFLSKEMFGVGLELVSCRRRQMWCGATKPATGVKDRCITQPRVSLITCCTVCYVACYQVIEYGGCLHS